MRHLALLVAIVPIAAMGQTVSCGVNVDKPLCVLVTQTNAVYAHFPQPFGAPLKISLLSKEDFEKARTADLNLCLRNISSGSGCNLYNDINGPFLESVYLAMPKAEKKSCPYDVLISSDSLIKTELVSDGSGAPILKDGTLQMRSTGQMDVAHNQALFAYIYGIRLGCQAQIEMQLAK